MCSEVGLFAERNFQRGLLITVYHGPPLKHAHHIISSVCRQACTYTYMCTMQTGDLVTHTEAELRPDWRHMVRSTHHSCIDRSKGMHHAYGTHIRRHLAKALSSMESRCRSMDVAAAASPMQSACELTIQHTCTSRHSSYAIMHAYRNTCLCACLYTCLYAVCMSMAPRLRSMSVFNVYTQAPTSGCKCDANAVIVEKMGVLMLRHTRIHACAHRRTHARMRNDAEHCGYSYGPL